MPKYKKNYRIGDWELVEFDQKNKPKYFLFYQNFLDNTFIVDERVARCIIVESYNEIGVLGKLEAIVKDYLEKPERWERYEKEEWEKGVNMFDHLIDAKIESQRHFEFPTVIHFLNGDIERNYHLK